MDLPAFANKPFKYSIANESLSFYCTDSHDTWRRCVLWGVNVQDTFVDSGRNCIAMVMPYYEQKSGEMLHHKLFLQF